MLVTDRFVFLHLHKSGGSFVIDCVRRYMQEAREIGYHLPGTLIPPAMRDRPVLGLVRNPWSYYVSWYAFQRRRPRPNQLFRMLSNEGRLDFPATIHNMLNLGQNDELLDRLVARLPGDYGGRGLNLPGFALASIRGSGLGFYSFLYDHMYARVTAGLHIGCMEDLPQGLLRLFDVVGQPVSDELRRYVLTAPPINTSRHGPYAAYFDKALRDRIAVRDRGIIERYAYRFDS